MSFNENFKDTYVALNGDVVFIDSKTKLESENAVIREKLSPLLSGEKLFAVSAIRFLPLGENEKEKIVAAFGAVFEEKEDAYLLEVTKESITVYANHLRGYLYGACTLRTHYRCGIREGLVYNVPLVQFRAVKMYLPAAEKIDEFYYMVDMFMAYGYNALVLEVGGAMEYKNHPEINDYWVEHCEIFGEYSHKADDFQHSQHWGKNSIHIENGGGKFLSQDLVREICTYVRAHGLEPIPEAPCLSHADYLMAGRTDFAERPEDPYPDTYCPSNPKSYEILFEVLDEVIAVFDPQVMHIGHDEYYVYGVCPRCKGKRGAELYAGDITKIHDYLAARGIRTMLWSEKLINSYYKDSMPAGGAHYTICLTELPRTVTYKGKTYPVYQGKNCNYAEAALLPPDAITSVVEETYPAIAMIPKDVIAMNWYWAFSPMCDQDYHYNGIPMVYGNFEGILFGQWRGRVAAGAKGFAVSSWGASDFKQMQRGKRLADVVYASRMSWSREYDETKRGLELSYSASSVFDYRFRDVMEGHHVDILHTTDLIIKHGYFGCGDFLEDDMFRLGYYHIYYKDGSDERVEILWGENVGPMRAVQEEGKVSSFEDDGRPADLGYCRETIFTCDFEDKEDGRYYRFVIPAKGEIDRVEPEIFEEYKEKLFIDSIKIK